MNKKPRTDASELLQNISKHTHVEKPVITVVEPKQESQTLMDTTLEKPEKEQLNTTVDPKVKQAISLIQADVQKKGAKKPKIGDVIETAIIELLHKRGLKL